MLNVVMLSVVAPVERLARTNALAYSPEATMVKKSVFARTPGDQSFLDQVLDIFWCQCYKLFLSVIYKFS
jgi:hypothetical protein